MARELTEQEQDLSKLHKRHLQQKQPYVNVAERARATYASELSAREFTSDTPMPYRNFYKEQVQTARGKVIEGEPRTQIKGRNLVNSKAAEFFQDMIDPIFSSESVVPILQSAGQDGVMYMAGYTLIMPTGEMEWINWYDLYVNNALATSKSIWVGRSVRIRKLRDVKQFIADWGPEIRKMDYEFDIDEGTDNLPKANSIPGRSPVGVSFAAHLDVAEKRTGFLYDHNGDLMHSSSIATSFVNTDDQLVEEWWHWIGEDVRDEQTREIIGVEWTLFKIFDDRILKEEKLPEWAPNGSLTQWNLDYLGGQYYQPIPYGDMAHGQASYNFIGHKAMQDVAIIRNPVLIAPEAMRGKLQKFNNTPREVLFETVPNGIRILDSKPIPQSHLEFRETVGRDTLRNGAVQDVDVGSKQKKIESGIAIAELKESSDTRGSRSQIQSRDEWLRDTGRWMAVYIYDSELTRAQATIDQEKEGMTPEAELEFDGVEGNDVESRLPEALRGLSHQMILDDLMFTFKIVPPTNIEDKVAIVVGAIERLSVALPTFAQSSPGSIVKLAGAITENNDLAEEMLAIVTEGQAEQEDAAEEAQEAETQAKEEEAQLEVDKEIEVNDAKSENTMDEDDNKSDNKIEEIKVEGDIKSEIQKQTEETNASMKLAKGEKSD